MSDKIIQRIILGPAPARNNWADSSLTKLTKPIIIGTVIEPTRRVLGSGKFNTFTDDSDTSDDDSNAGDKTGTTLVKLDPDSPYFIKKICVDVTTLEIRIREMLRATIPPKIWEYDGKVYFQEALAKPITRIEVKQLKQNFNRWLVQRRSTPFGLCAVRRDILREALDEITRQALMVAPERGLSLIRVRNELELSLRAYNTIASQAFYYKHVPDPIRKSDIEKLKIRNEELDSEIAEQKEKIKELQEVISRKEIIIADSSASRQFIHNSQKLELERNITQLKLHLKALNAWGKEFLMEQAANISDKN